MEIVRAYKIFADRLFNWTVESFDREIDNGFPILRLIAAPELSYQSELSTEQRRALYYGMSRRSAYANRVPRGVSGPFADNAVDRDYWASIGGTEVELDACFAWWHGFLQQRAVWAAKHPSPSISNRELRKALVPHIGHTLGVKAQGDGYQSIYLQVVNGWQICTQFSHTGCEAEFQSTVARYDSYADPEKHPVTNALAFGPGMGIAFPGWMLYNTFEIPRAIDAISTILSLQWSAMERLTVGLGPDDPEPDHEFVSRLRGDRTARMLADDVAAEKVRSSGYDLCFVRTYVDVDIEEWIRSSGVRAFLLGRSPGWTAFAPEAPFGSLPQRLVASNPGYLVRTRCHKAIGWSFDIFDNATKVCSFSCDWRGGYVKINSGGVDLSVIERLSGLSQMDYAFRDNIIATSALPQEQLRTLAQLLTSPSEWSRYEDDISPDRLFAEALFLPDTIESDDFDGLTFEQLISQYADDSGTLEDMGLPDAKLVEP